MLFIPKLKWFKIIDFARKITILYLNSAIFEIKKTLFQKKTIS